MDRRLRACSWLCVCVLASGRCLGAEPTGPVKVPLELLSAEQRERVRAVIESPTLRVSGRPEVFACHSETYHWLLEHPDQACRLWRLLGAHCADVQEQGGGRFGWTDGQGSALHWDTVIRTPRQHVWYAEGRVKPGFLLGTVSVRALVILHLTEGHDREGQPAMRHQAELVLRADSAALAVAARVLGASAPGLAEQYVGQIETFFGALAWYLDDDTDRARELFEKLNAGQAGH
jgi:hypothetical protein